VKFGCKLSPLPVAIEPRWHCSASRFWIQNEHQTGFLQNRRESARTSPRQYPRQPKLNVSRVFQSVQGIGPTWKLSWPIYFAGWTAFGECENGQTRVVQLEYCRFWEALSEFNKDKSRSFISSQSLPSTNTCLKSIISVSPFSRPRDQRIWSNIACACWYEPAFVWDSTRPRGW
jgi:hypothetical protein